MRKIVTRLIAALVLASILVLAILWNALWEPRLLVSKTRFGNMLKLSWQIEQFESDHGRLPTNLEEVVFAGLLPPKAHIYSCPMKNGTVFFDKVVSYENCEYELTFRTNEIVMAIPPSVFDQDRFRNVPDKWRELRIEAGIAKVVGPATFTP